MRQYVSVNKMYDYKETGNHGRLDGNPVNNVKGVKSKYNLDEIEKITRLIDAKLECVKSESPYTNIHRPTEWPCPLDREMMWQIMYKNGNKRESFAVVMNKSTGKFTIDQIHIEMDDVSDMLLGIEVMLVEETDKRREKSSEYARKVWEKKKKYHFM